MARKLIYAMLASLDRNVTDEEGKLDWAVKARGRGLAQPGGPCYKCRRRPDEYSSWAFFCSLQTSNHEDPNQWLCTRSANCIAIAVGGAEPCVSAPNHGVWRSPAHRMP